MAIRAGGFLISEWSEQSPCLLLVHKLLRDHHQDNIDTHPLSWTPEPCSQGGANAGPNPWYSYTSTVNQDRCCRCAMPPFVIAVPVIRLPHRHRMRLRFEYSAGKPSLRFARHAVPRCQSAADSSGRGGTGRGPRRPWDPIARMFGLVPDQMDEGPPWMGLTWPDSHFHSPAVLLQLLKSFVVVRCPDPLFMPHTWIPAHSVIWRCMNGFG